MNIHINKEFFDNIINNTIYYKFIIGSHLYGLNDEESDIDYLIIYHPFYNQIIDPFLNQHQFQYKDIENNIDYNLVDLITFIKNLVSGDSTINYELINSEQLIKTDLKFLYDIRSELMTYNIAKSYLGFARRDIRHINKRLSFKDKKSGVLHINRSYLIAKNIIHKDYELNVLYDSLKNFKSMLNLMEDIEINKLIKNFNIKIDSARNDLSTLHNTNGITRYLNPDIQEKINNNLYNILNISKYKLPLYQIHYHNEFIEFKY